MSSTTARSVRSAPSEIPATPATTEIRLSVKKFAQHFGLDVIDQGALMFWGHLFMLPAMAVVMLLRPHEYAHC